MSNNLISQQLPASAQGELGTISGKMDPPLQMAMMGSLLHHLPVAKMQVGPMIPCISISPSERVSSPNMVVRSSNLISSYSEAPPQPVLIEQQEHNVMVQSPFVPCDPAAGSLSTKNSTAQLPSKRKSPMEFMSNRSVAKLLSVPNKRMASSDPRPWSQGTYELNKGHVLASSLSPRTQYLPALSKKTVQLESVTGNKSAKQTAPRKQNAQKQLPPKPQNESSESLRCKMRESLAGALSLVHSDSPTMLKSFQSQTARKFHLGFQIGDPTSAAAGVNAMLPIDSTPTRAHDIGLSVQKVGLKETVLPNISTLDKTEDAKDGDTQDSQFVNPFPKDNVSYSDNVFSKDDLLQGNDLPWMLDSDVEFSENSQTKITEALAAENGSQGRIKEKPILDPQLLAFEIEAELFKLFGGVNKKYKEKGRSLIFNLKDKSNPELREKVMYGEIPAERLCSMSAEELASKELAEWRQAKAEEMAQMVVLPDTQVDIRCLVRKTHKGEFQVEVEPMDSGSVEVSVGLSSLMYSQKKSSSIIRKRNSSAPAIPSDVSSGPAKVITVDDEMKDATGSLPPIVSLDEFMVSLDSDLPSESLSTDAGKETPGSDKNDAETSSVSISPKQSPNGCVGTSPVKPGNTDTGSLKPSTDVTTSITIPAGERVWEGSFQLSVSSVTSVVGIFRSGEKTSAGEWPVLLEIKGRVRLEAFEKFLQELPNSRSRAIMVMCFACKEECPKTERDNLSEVVDSYIKDERVGFVEPAAGVELYLCPTKGRATEIISKIVTRNQLDFLKSLDHGLIGVVVWRRSQLKQPSSVLSSSSTKSHNHHRGKGGSSTVNKTRNGDMVLENDHDHDDDDDCDLPPGFGPGAVASAMPQGNDEDDLPEFNYGSHGHVVMNQRTTMHSRSQSLHQVRELIHKYGKSMSRTFHHGDDGDDENDIPEWNPNLNSNLIPPSYSHHSHGGSAVGPESRSWAHHYHHQPGSRGGGI
ncbi:PREDICTED: uncharacterized protein LOC104819888 [Tarenaya hassleriana]|uniref:uncharacterized protein LOC104819888 n=1 Tax=Tarenaya hassleriana TaxID=28532 RepID=UPI00053C8872|nr:PREDICTED: uncharacterized protein LOC104819888 [Tarenaya hassleriana]